MLKRLKEEFIAASLTILMCLLVFNALLMFYNRSVLIENNVLQKQTEEVKKLWISIFDGDLRRMDLGLRGYALVHNPTLLEPYFSGLHDIPVTVKKIDSLLVVQRLDTTRTKFAAFNIKLNEFLQHSDNMRALAQQDSLKDFVNLLNQDKGYDLWKLYAPTFNGVLAYEDKLVSQATNKYQNALDRNVIFQLLLIVLAVPTLIAVIYRIKRDAHSRKKLLLDFEENNRKYMFDPGTELPQDNQQMIIENSIQNLKKTSTFIKSIATGNYAVKWDGLDESNIHLNTENLTADLLKMRDQMKQVKENDEKRIWSTEGIAKFSEVARNNQSNIEKLSNEVIRFLTKHLKAQQGSLFLWEDEEGEEPGLVLAACYAFDKKKYIQKRIPAGTGLIGQAYLEGSTVVLTDLPKGYISITSGLGDATPTCLIIVPMKNNDRVEAVLELASFSKFEAHEVEFLEKAGEVIASSIHATKTNERTSKLLRETQEQAETMKAQEEELRQNMEEMQATQENMRRAQSELR
jgi:CHASE3 domain sensor protein/putative methionine-R-sulfoxide reductase with GAF domain